jgi:hypothetical protein
VFSYPADATYAGDLADVLHAASSSPPMRSGCALRPAGDVFPAVALPGHVGPWTADDVEALGDIGDHARFGVYDGGILVMRPTRASVINVSPTGCTARSPGQ